MISNFHAKAIDGLPNARLAACFDMHGPAAERLAGETGCSAYTELDKFLSDARSMS